MTTLQNLFFKLDGPPKRVSVPQCGHDAEINVVQFLASRKARRPVIPAKAGIQSFQKQVDSRLQDCVATTDVSLRATEGSAAISLFSMNVGIASVALLPRNDSMTQPLCRNDNIGILGGIIPSYVSCKLNSGLSFILWVVLFVFLCGGFLSATSSYAGDLNSFQRISPDEYPQFEDDLNFGQLAESIQGSIEYLNKQSPLTTIEFGEDRYSTRHLSRSLQNFLSFIQTHPSNAELQEYILRNYYVYAYAVLEWELSFSPSPSMGEGEGGGEIGYNTTPQGDSAVMSLRGRETTEAIPQHIENMRLPRSLGVARNDKQRISSHLTGGKEETAVHDVVKSRTVEVLFTGYYEPMLKGSRQQSDKFKYPVYSRPQDLVTLDLADFSNSCAAEKAIGRYTGETVVPYYSRQEISDSNVLSGKAHPIAWVDDPVDLFFLHIQGSGKIVLDDSKTINVHYLISNGHPYKSIGKYLIEKNRLSKDEVSMQAIRSYLRAHPDEAGEIFNYNPRYVFFEEVSAGPIGCFNIALTPGRSIALDRKQYPPAAMAFIQTQKPVVSDGGKIQEWADFSRFVMNQDTGSAITGPNRADIFWGHDSYAELAAGYMKQPGRLYFLVLKPFYN